MKMSSLFRYFKLIFAEIVKFFIDVCIDILLPDHFALADFYRWNFLFHQFVCGISSDSERFSQIFNR